MAQIKSDLGDAADDLAEMALRLEEDVPAAVNTKARILKLDILNQIREEGLVNENDTKPEQVDLKDSFILRRIGQKNWIIYSVAPHALPLEDGTNHLGGYEIKPNDADLLSWVPENPANYPSKDEVSNERGFVVEGTWYDPDAGRVFSTGVEHPGVEPHKYVFRAQASWEVDLARDIFITTGDAIVSSGFKPSE